MKGLAYLKAQNLVEEKSSAYPAGCVTPHTIGFRAKPKRTPDDDIKDHQQPYDEQDHAKLREMIVAYVRNTGNKRARAEMTYQIE